MSGLKRFLIGFVFLPAVFCVTMLYAVTADFIARGYGVPTAVVFAFTPICVIAGLMYMKAGE
jgi:hypothetical protein